PGGSSSEVFMCPDGAAGTRGVVIGIQVAAAQGPGTVVIRGLRVQCGVLSKTSLAQGTSSACFGSVACPTGAASTDIHNLYQPGFALPFTFSMGGPDVILTGLHGRAGARVDALGVRYVTVRKHITD
ncbi:MAG: hypothetical protein KC503_10055, partial [Myxococcales bacterium]|nr:hypothetical protein [Myxococcales bacterium]